MFRNSILFAPDGGGGGGAGGDGGAPPAGSPPPAAGSVPVGAPPAGTPPAAPPPAAGAAGASEPDALYHSQLGPELRKDEKLRAFLRKHPKLNDLALAAQGMSQKLDRAVIIPDAAKPDPAEMKAFREKMGIPGSDTEYEIKTDAYKDAPGLDQSVAFVRKQAARLGLTKTQGQGLFDLIMGIGKAGSENTGKLRQQAAETFDARLLEAAGKDPKKAEAINNLYQRHLVKRIGDADLIKRIEASGLLYDPAYAMKYAAIEELLGEEPFIEGRPQGGGGEKKKGPGKMGGYSQEFKARYANSTRGKTARRK